MSRLDQQIPVGSPHGFEIARLPRNDFSPARLGTVSPKEVGNSLSDQEEPPERG